MDYQTVSKTLKAVRGKSTLDSSSITEDDITIKVGDEVKIHAMGSTQVGFWKVVGFAEPQVWMYHLDGAKAQADWYINPNAATVVLQARQGGMYRIDKASEVVGFIRNNKAFQKVWDKESWGI